MFGIELETALDRVDEMALPGWLTAMAPLVKEAKTWEILKEQVVLLTMQRDDAINELDKADKALEKANEEITGLKKQIDKLTKEFVTLAPVNEELAWIGGAYFKKDANGVPTGRAFCAHCWDSEKKLSGLAKVLHTAYRCPSCKNPVQRSGAWPPQN